MRQPTCNSRLRRRIPRASWIATLTIWVSSEFDWVPASVSKGRVVETIPNIHLESSHGQTYAHEPAHMHAHMHTSQHVNMHSRKKEKQTMKSYPCDTCLNLMVCKWPLRQHQTDVHHTNWKWVVKIKEWLADEGTLAWYAPWPELEWAWIQTLPSACCSLYNVLSYSSLSVSSPSF